MKDTYMSNLYTRTTYEELGSKHHKKIKWEEQGKRCNICGFDKYELDIGPYQLRHKDGNRKNRNHDNEEVLCCNCHAMTENFVFKNRKHSEKSKELIRGDKNGMFEKV